MNLAKIAKGTKGVKRAGKAAKAEKRTAKLGKAIKSARKAGRVIVGTRILKKTAETESVLAKARPFLKPKRVSRKANLKNALKYRQYIRDIEAQTGRKIPKSQLRELKDALKANKYEKLGDADKVQHRKSFNDVKDNLITDWEKNTGQVWPKHGKLEIGKSGKVLRNPTSPYDAHEIIPNMNGGPLQWWNIHPARWPNEHQGGIHRAGGVWNSMFGN